MSTSVPSLTPTSPPTPTPPPAVEAVAVCDLPTPWATFRLHGFRDLSNGQEHVALTLGDVADGSAPVLARMHSECLTGDGLFSQRCDCGPQLEAALKRGEILRLYLPAIARSASLPVFSEVVWVRQAGTHVEAGLRFL